MSDEPYVYKYNTNYKSTVLESSLAVSRNQFIINAIKFILISGILAVIVSISLSVKPSANVPGVCAATNVSMYGVGSSQQWGTFFVQETPWLGTITANCTNSSIVAMWICDSDLQFRPIVACSPYVFISSNKKVYAFEPNNQGKTFVAYEDTDQIDDIVHSNTVGAIFVSAGNNVSRIDMMSTPVLDVSIDMAKLLLFYDAVLKSDLKITKAKDGIHIGLMYDATSSPGYPQFSHALIPYPTFTKSDYNKYWIPAIVYLSGFFKYSSNTSTIYSIYNRIGAACNSNICNSIWEFGTIGNTGVVYSPLFGQSMVLCESNTPIVTAVNVSHVFAVCGTPCAGSSRKLYQLSDPLPSGSAVINNVSTQLPCQEGSTVVALELGNGRLYVLIVSDSNLIINIYNSNNFASADYRRTSALTVAGGSSIATAKLSVDMTTLYVAANFATGKCVRIFNATTLNEITLTVDIPCPNPYVRQIISM